MTKKYEVKSVPFLGGNYPEFPNDDFYKKFNDPHRAFWGLQRMYTHYFNFNLIYPDCEIDYINYAWLDAQNTKKEMKNA